MTIKKITDALVESCNSMRAEGILSQSALDKCKLLKETNVLKSIYDSDPLEKKLYKKNIDTRKDRYLADFNVNKKNRKIVLIEKSLKL